MKRPAIASAILLTLAIAFVWAAQQISQPPAPAPSAIMPSGALLYIEAKDFASLLRNWNSSQEKRIWVASDNYTDFSRSRLFQRLSQAQNEFSAAAGLAANNSLLTSVAGRQSAIALYDIGNLEFLYVTRISQHDAESTPLWQLRPHFEQRTEGATQFYVRQDPQSGRVAAFAVSDGWLILGTRADLLAGVLDHLQSSAMRGLAADGWFAQTVHAAPATPGDLRMVLNLDKLVPSPYFRSYWVQQNITEMKQYAAAVSDLYRTPQSDREQRILLRKPGLPATTGDVAPLAALVPADAAFYSAQASPQPASVLATLRDNLLDPAPASAQPVSFAPPLPSYPVAGSSSQMETRIDQAPVVVPQSDPYQSLRALLTAAQPSAMLQVYSTATSPSSPFVQIHNAIILQSAQPWSESDIQQAIIAALRPGLTAARLGLQWTPRSSPSGSYFALDGRVSLCGATRGNLLYLASDPSLLQQLLAHPFAAAPAPAGLTYTAVFRHSPAQQQRFRALFSQIDTESHAGGLDGHPVRGQSPAFFSGNIASLSRMFSRVGLESVQEKDQGATVTQTVTYQWQ